MQKNAWVRIIPVNEADEHLKQAYQQAIDPKTGEPANILGVQSANPQAMMDHVALYRTLMFKPSPLSRRQREMIALVVSAANNCFY